MTFSTQSSSKPRLKNNTIGTDTLKDVWARVETMSTEDYRAYCVSVVQSGGGYQPTKDAIIRTINNTNNVKLMMKKVTDFVMAGDGYGV